MDWARAKTILLTLLFVLNILLGGTILSRAADGGDTARIYQDVTEILARRGVQLHCAFPRDIRSSALLIYKDDSRFVAALAGQLAAAAGTVVTELDTEGGAASAAAAADVEVVMLGREAFRYRNRRPEAGEVAPSAADPDAGAADANAAGTFDARMDEAVRRALAQKGMDLSAFVTDAIVSEADGGVTAQYILAYQDQLVFDSGFEVRVAPSGGIAEITANCRGIRGVSDNKSMRVIPAYQVILKNYRGPDQVIRAIEIGFMGQNSDQENLFIESEEGAVWRVRLEDGTTRFFEAAYGDEIHA
jgi:hypothetical protein